MPKNYWMVVQTPENFQISKERGFDVHGFRPRYRRRAERMERDDPVLFYISGLRKWAAIATITSRYFEDRTPIWKSNRRDESFPYRVNLSLSIVLEEEDYVDGLILGPRLEYVKRWPPERWPLAFHDSLHILPQKDFRLIEAEMKRIRSRRRRKGRGGLSRRDGRRDERRAEGSSDVVSPDGDREEEPADALVEEASRGEGSSDVVSPDGDREEEPVDALVEEAGGGEGSSDVASPDGDEEEEPVDALVEEAGSGEGSSDVLSPDGDGEEEPGDALVEEAGRGEGSSELGAQAAKAAEASDEVGGQRPSTDAVDS